MLASGSPQRRALLESLGVQFSVRVPHVTELEQGEDPAAVAIENALRKARAAVRAGAHEVVLGCDTIVVLDGVIFGKPAGPAQARATLQALAGRTHEVLSGLALLRATRPPERRLGERTALARTEVSFRELEAGELERHVARGEWRGRSGGYAIQGAAAALAVSVAGELENVVGLPLETLKDLYPELLQNHSRGPSARK